MKEAGRESKKYLRIDNSVDEKKWISVWLGNGRWGLSGCIVYS